MELNPIEQMIAAWPEWWRLLSALPAAIALAWGVWATRDRVR